MREYQEKNTNQSLLTLIDGQSTILCISGTCFQNRIHIKLFDFPLKSGCWPHMGRALAPEMHVLRALVSRCYNNYSYFNYHKSQKFP
jgi:hypothetical protein